MFSIAVLSFICVLCRVQSYDKVPIIQTKFGAISGVYKADSNGQYNFYMGIPFARLPDSLFGDAVDLAPWSGVYEANSDEAKCPQREDIYKTLVGNPDCLYLNVYVPAKRSTTKPLSVFYWIYGGKNKFGYAGRYMWGPEFLMRHDIIVVTANYRIGPYGFMCLGTKEIPGNAGLKDVLRALRWVHDNISGFGGNPKDITVGGSSTGSSIVEFLIASPLAHGLFHRTIRQSGSKIVHLNIMNKTSHEAVLNLAGYFGFNDDVNKSVQFLKQVAPLDLILAVEKLNLDFLECVEPYFDGKEAFFTQGHTETIVNGNYSGFDTLMGVNCQEEPVRNEINEESVGQRLNKALTTTYMVDDEDKMEVGKTVLNFYIGSKPLTQEVQREISRLYSDERYLFTVHLALQHLLRRDKTIYFYEFCYRGNRNHGQFVNKIHVDGAMHTDELGYLFNQGMWGGINAKDKLIIDRMTKMWTNFIKYGNPTPVKAELLPVKWLPIIQNGMQHYLKINTELSMDVDLNRERMAFWNLLMTSYFEIWKV